MNKFTSFFSSTSGISDITYSDEEDFYRYLKNTKEKNFGAFENNFAYILQSCRPFFKKFEAFDSACYFTFHTISDGETRLVITNSVGKNHLKIKYELSQIALAYGIKTLIKNVGTEELDFWSEHGFKKSDIAWSKFSTYDDNTFPQYNYSSDIILGMKFNRDYRRIFRKYELEHNCVTEELELATKKESVEKLVNLNALFLAGKQIDVADEIIAAHKFFFETRIKRKLLLEHKVDDKTVGFSYLTVVPETNYAYYNAVFNENNSNIMKYILFAGMKHVFENIDGIIELGLQGSENEGQNFMKYRFNPSSTIQKFHMIN